MHVFEFDADKSQANKKRHGIDFLTAQQLCEDPYLIAIQAKSDDEPRFLAIGLIGTKHWSAVTTYRKEKSNYSPPDKAGQSKRTGEDPWSGGFANWA